MELDNDIRPHTLPSDDTVEPEHPNQTLNGNAEASGSGNSITRRQPAAVPRRQGRGRRTMPVLEQPVVGEDVHAASSPEDITMLLPGQEDDLNARVANMGEGSGSGSRTMEGRSRAGVCAPNVIPGNPAVEHAPIQSPTLPSAMQSTPHIQHPSLLNPTATASSSVAPAQRYPTSISPQLTPEDQPESDIELDEQAAKRRKIDKGKGKATVQDMDVDVVDLMDVGEQKGNVIEEDEEDGVVEDGKRLKEDDLLGSYRESLFTQVNRKRVDGSLSVTGRMSDLSSSSIASRLDSMWPH